MPEVAFPGFGHRPAFVQPVNASAPTGTNQAIRLAAFTLPIANATPATGTLVGHMAMASIRNPDSLTGAGDSNYLASASTALVIYVGGSKEPGHHRL